MMAAPVPYTRFTNFVSYALNNPSAPYNPADHDAEFNAILLTLQGTLTLLNGITRSDGQLKNSLVTIDTLSTSLIATFSVVNGYWDIRGAWVTGQTYGIGSIITNSNNTYVGKETHVAGVFATDLAAGKWIPLFQTAGLPNSPALLNGSGLLPLEQGGTEADLSATGGAGQYVKQSTAGGALTVGTIPVADVVGAQPSATAAVAANVLALAGGSMTGGINEDFATIAATAATTPLWTAANGNVQVWTGTPTIIAFPAAPQAGARRTVFPAAGTIFSHGGGITVIGGQNYTTAAGDEVEIIAVTLADTIVRVKPRANGQRGTTSNDNALATYVGEYVEGLVAFGAAAALTTNTPLNVTSISLTAGDWDVSGNVGFLAAAATSITQRIGSISSTSATLSADKTHRSHPAQVPTALQNVDSLPVTRISIASTTTIYLVAQATFTLAALSAFGRLSARRVR